MSWFLSLIGIDPTVSMRITSRNFSIESGSWAGLVKRVIPFRNISSAYYGYQKPWKEVLAVLIVLLPVAIGGAGPADGWVVWPITIGGAFLYYKYNTTLSLGVVENAGIDSGISFKPSVIENRKIDERQSAEVIQLIQTLIDIQ
jgi:hypothetical protein